MSTGHVCHAGKSFDTLDKLLFSKGICGGQYLYALLHDEPKGGPGLLRVKRLACYAGKVTKCTQSNSVTLSKQQQQTMSFESIEPAVAMPHNAAYACSAVITLRKAQEKRMFRRLMEAKAKH